MKRIDVTGQRFGRLLVCAMVYEAGKDSKAQCVCDCGSAFTATVYNMRSGNTSSCGCLDRELKVARGRVHGSIQGKKNATHGMSKTPTYVSWQDARKRCFSPKNKRFAEYGGRGITMCAEWADSFESFLADMGVAPPGMTLERERVNGDYEPGNCKWATRAEQSQNTRRNRATWEIVDEMRRRHAGGELVSDLAREFSMSLSNAKLIVSGQTWKRA